MSKREFFFDSLCGTCPPPPPPPPSSEMFQKEKPPRTAMTVARWPTDEKKSTNWKSNNDNLFIHWPSPASSSSASSSFSHHLLLIHCIS